MNNKSRREDRARVEEAYQKYMDVLVAGLSRAKDPCEADLALDAAEPHAKRYKELYDLVYGRTTLY